MNKSVGVYFNVLKKNIVVDRISVQTYKNALSGLDNHYVYQFYEPLRKNYLITNLREAGESLFGVQPSERGVRWTCETK